MPPVLAVEVQGELETEEILRAKAQWYLSQGVEIVWLVMLDSREVIVSTNAAEERFALTDRMPVHPSLPGLAPLVRELFAQVASSSGT